ncbi:MAG: hypothetical protein JSR46_11205 [Verrucomicrobia bacterium]|nr:hypothetical protein [Verrucomicrobiota bacterium]
MSLLSLDGMVLPPNNIVEITTVESLKQCKGKLFEKIEDAIRNPIPLGQKIVWLQQVGGEAKRITNACIRLEKEAADTIEDLPFLERVVEQIGVLLKCGLFGPHSSSLVTVQAVQVAVTAQLSELGKRELRTLDGLNTSNAPQTMPILHLYHLIGELQPEDRHYLKGLADRLMIERAYDKALEKLEQCPESPDLEVQRKKIVAMTGCGRYDDALNSIAACKLTFSGYQDTPKIIEIRAQLDDMKADCLVGLKNYSEAREVLGALIKKGGYYKHKMIFSTIADEINHFTVVASKFFLQRAKKQFNQLDDYVPIVWGQQGLEADLDFWLFVLRSNPAANENKAICEHVMREIHALIESGLVSVAAIENGVQRIADELQNEVSEFKLQLQTFMQETSSKEIPIAEDIQKAIHDARLKSMTTKIYGDKITGSNAGMLHKITVVGTLLEYLKKQPSFEKSEQKTKLHNLTLGIESAMSELKLCLKGLNILCHEGFHPLADKITLAIMPANQVLALEGAK